MKKSFVTALIAACAALAGVAAPLQVHAQSEASAALSMLPVASVVGTASLGASAASAVVALPAALSVAGSTLTVVAVEASVDGTVYLLERASDGARASIRLAGQSATAIGTGVVVTAMSAGWLLSAAGQAIAFIPNEIGKSLLYNERVTR